MSMYQLLTDKDKDLITNYIEAYAGSLRAELEYVLRFWDKSKYKYLTNMFGDKLILKKEIEFEKDFSELLSELYNKVSSGYSECKCKSFIDFWRKLISDKSDLWKANSVSRELSILISDEVLTRNRVESSFEIETEGKTLKIQRGQRAVNAIIKIAKAFGCPEEYIEEFRLAHSLVLNQKKTKGTLCLSIHPLDYMTMSDNRAGWSSCMSWRDDGCYRQGTVEMMNSEMVVVAYLESSTPMTMPGHWLGEDGYTWNSKKWRQLYIVTPEVITNIKAYPYDNGQLTRIALTWLKELAEKAFVGTYRPNFVTNTEDASFKVDDERIYLNPETGYMYNDFDSQYEGVAYFTTEELNSNISLYYSGESECICCGGTTNIDFDGAEGRLVCYDCEPDYCCEYCGDHFYSDEDLCTIDGVTICSYCADRETFYCDITKETHLDENATSVRMGYFKEKGSNKFIVLDTPAISIYCDCSDDEIEKYFGTNIMNSDAGWYCGYVVDIHAMKPSLVKDFVGYSSAEEVIENYPVMEEITICEEDMKLLSEDN